MKYQPPFGSPGVDDPYVNGDPSIARKGSIPPAASIEFPQREIVNFITNSDQLPDDGDLEQLTRGVRNQWVNFCVDTGAVNALSVALNPTLTAYKQGFPLRVLVGNTNTGPSTINVNVLGNRPIKRSSGAQLEPDDLKAGMVALLVDDGTNFQLCNYLGAAGSTVNNVNIDIPYAEDASIVANIIDATYVPAITSVVAGDLVLVKVANTNNGAVTIVINGLAPQPVRRNDGLALQGFDLLAGECILIEYNTTYWQMLRLVRSQVYFKLAADLTLYVRTDGNDTTGDGSLNDAAHAFRTIQRAVTYVRDSFLIAGRKVTIQLGVTGTYTGAVSVLDLPGALVIRGDPANMAGYVVQGVMGASTISVSGAGAKLTVTGVTLSQVDGSYLILQANGGPSLNISDMAFTGVPSAGAVSINAASCTVSGYIHFWQNCATAFSVHAGGSLTIGLWFTLINTHGPYWSVAFVQCFGNSYAQITEGYCTFAGFASGSRYQSVLNSVIYTGSGNATYLPGNMDGIVDYSSVYA